MRPVNGVDLTTTNFTIETNVKATLYVIDVTSIYQSLKASSHFPLLKILSILI